MQLTKNFSLAELTKSQTASREGFSNRPTKAQIAKLKTLCEKVLQPLRDHYGRPVIVTSGYRSPALNRAIGGSTSSQHSHGEAADFTVAGISNLEVCRWLEKNLNYDQLIYEFGEDGWIHVSYREGRLRNQELQARRVKGRTRYFSGLPRRPW